MSRLLAARPSSSRPRPPHGPQAGGQVCPVAKFARPRAVGGGAPSAGAPAVRADADPCFRPVLPPPALPPLCWPRARPPALAVMSPFHHDFAVVVLADDACVYVCVALFVSRAAVTLESSADSPP